MRVKWTSAGLVAATVVVMAACSGGGDSGGSDPVASGVSGNFVADLSPVCPNTAVDTLSLRKVNVLGRVVTVGMQVTDCDSSLGIYGVNFDLQFDPSIAQCPGVNPCSPGTLLSSPLATSNPQCTCDNGTGKILGSFTKVHPGVNDSISPGGSKDIVVITLHVMDQGASRLDFLGTGSMNGSAVITLNNNSPQAIPGLNYQGGSVTGQ
ncbi:MAG: hypothetical protein ACREAA_07005 [Candidatus Polarisedimenticolia bacterium]